MEDNFKIEVKSDKDELIIRRGDAAKPLPLPVPQKLTIEGDFKAVGNFLKGRIPSITTNEYQVAVPEHAIIYTNRAQLSIVLHCNPNHPLATVVEGKAERSEELKLFGINTGSKYRRDELFKLIRMNKIHFADPQQYNDLLSALKKFKASTTGGTTIDKDLRGNADLQYSKTLDSNMPETFKLTIPVIKGEPKMTFNVEVCLDESDGIPSFWFESPELNEKTAVIVEEMFERELARCDGFVVVNV